MLTIYYARKKLMWQILLVTAALVCGSDGVKIQMSSIRDNTGKFEGHFVINAPQAVDGWMLNITFCSKISGFSQWQGDLISNHNDGIHYDIVNKPYDGLITKGGSVSITVTGSYSGSKAPCASAEFTNMGIDPFHINAPKDPDHTKYNYDEILMKSILFYEAQRSGKLPANNRIPWRGDSALGDKGNNGEDLTGGWYDAGDHVKFGLPMAYSTTVLLWGLIQFEDAYAKAGQLNHMYDSVKWPLDYFIKAHTSKNELYVQVGDGGQDHAYWGRAEDMTMKRPAFKITTSCPGADVAAETAAAMAAGYIAFKQKNPTYAATLLRHSKELYDFALNNPGIYTNCINQAAAYYRSMGYKDELAWGGAWLYWATKEQKYLTSAEQYHQNGSAWGFSWDDKQAGETVLLYKLTKKDKYKTDIEQTYHDWMPGGTIPYTPHGLAFRLQWGANRYACNMAFTALMAAEEGLHAAEYRKWAKQEIHYVLGDAGHSFVVGFGTNPPQRPHHRSSSCPMMPAPCGWADQRQPGPNPHVLYGALVGGPGKDGSYEDKRDDYVKNEVATDYNAAFQGGVAALKSLYMRKLYPSK